jgi:murein DD-endopeptidase MepM/ murein hydrolase activator NlpD
MNKFIALTFALFCQSIFAFEVIDNPYNGGIKVIDFQTNLANPKAFFYGNQVLVQKVKDNHFQAIIGIPLSAKKGYHNLIIKDFGERNTSFEVFEKEYKKQYITLKGKKKKYVDLNKKQIARIVKEKKILQKAKDIFSEKILADDFVMPTTGTTTGVFGSQRFFNNKPRRPHSGIDIANKTGTNIKAITSGRVILTGDFYFNGKTILIDHGQGFMSVYVHLDKILVQNGDNVKTGGLIAKMGATGRATGPHLHFGTYLNNVVINPEVFYAK